VQGFREALPAVFDEVFAAMLERCDTVGKGGSGQAFK
jgi:hypothetical protein